MLKNGGSGRIAIEIKEKGNASNYEVKYFNRQIWEFNLMRAKIIVASRQEGHYSFVALPESETFVQPFYTQDRVMEWHLPGDIDELIHTNETSLEMMKKALEELDK